MRGGPATQDLFQTEWLLLWLFLSLVWEVIWLAVLGAGLCECSYILES